MSPKRAPKKTRKRARPNWEELRNNVHVDDDKKRPLKFGESALFDWMYERNKWGLMPVFQMAIIARLFLQDFEAAQACRKCTETYKLGLLLNTNRKSTTF